MCCFRSVWASRTPKTLTASQSSVKILSRPQVCSEGSEESERRAQWTREFPMSDIMGGFFGQPKNGQRPPYYEWLFPAPSLKMVLCSVWFFLSVPRPFSASMGSPRTTSSVTARKRVFGPNPPPLPWEKNKRHKCMWHNFKPMLGGHSENILHQQCWVPKSKVKMYLQSIPPQLRRWTLPT